MAKTLEIMLEDLNDKAQQEVLQFGHLPKRSRYSRMPWLTRPQSKMIALNCSSQYLI
jgi:hypothetical protein